MRWGAGAGASRLISGNMKLHRRLEERLAAFKGYEAALLFGSGYLANTGTIAALAGRGEVVFSDELNHASIIDGCRLSRAETFVYRHGDLEHLAWGLRKAGAPRLADRHRRRLLDGRRRRAARRAASSWRARHGCRLMVDEAHATGALGPGGRGSVAAAGLGRRGRRGRRHARQGARRLRRLRLRRAREIVDTCSTRARPFIFSTAPAAARRRRGAARPWRCSRRSRAGSSGCARNAAVLREALAAEGLDRGRLADPDRAGRGRRRAARPWSSASGRSSAASSPRGSARRPSPRAPRGCGLTVMATHRRGRAAAAAARDRRRRRARAGDRRRRGDAPPPPAARRLGVAVRGRLRHRHRHRGRQDGGRGGRSPARGRRGALGRRLQARASAASTTPRRARPRAAAPRRGLRAGRRRDRALPLRAAGLAAPRRRARRRADRARAACARRPRAAAAGADCSGLRGRRRAARAARRPATWSATSPRDLGLPLVIAASPGLGTINHTLLTIEAARAVGLEVARWCSRRGPPSRRSVEASNRETIARLGRSGRDAADARPRRPGAWPATPRARRGQLSVRPARLRLR